MSIFTKTTLADKPKTVESGLAAYLFAGLLIIFAVGQLFEFDKFIELFGAFNFLGGEAVSRIAAAMIVVFEVFALPFLLGMRLSKLFRIVSMVLGWFAVFGWLKISLWINMAANSATNFGLLGTKIQLIPGWWAVPFCVALCILAVWVSWGLWPLQNGKKRK